MSFHKAAPSWLRAQPIATILKGIGCAQPIPWNQPCLFFALRCFPTVALLRLTTPLASIVLPRLGILFFIRVTIVLLVLLALSAMLFLTFFYFYVYVVSSSSWYAPFALPYFPPRPLREFLEFRIGSCVKALPQTIEFELEFVWVRRTRVPNSIVSSSRPYGFCDIIYI